MLRGPAALAEALQLDQLRRLTAARTGVSDCAGFAPNQTQLRLALAALSLTPATLLPSAFFPFASIGLFFLAAAQLKEETRSTPKDLCYQTFRSVCKRL